MTIKSEYETADEIPAQYRELYEQRGNKWELAAIEGVKPESAFADVGLVAERFGAIVCGQNAGIDIGH